MTREELSNRHFIFTKINEQNQEEITAIIDGSLLIPKPKFKVGDRVHESDNSEMKVYGIWSVYYDPTKKEWFYILNDNLAYDEDELELVEAG